MSQHDMTLDNASGASLRADANAALVALASKSSGASAPSPTFPNQEWVDTTNAVVKRRDNGNSAWAIVDTMDTDRVLEKSTAYTVQLRDFGKLIMCDTTSAGFTLTLPAVASAGEGFNFVAKNEGTGSFNLTLDGDGSEAINGATTITVSDGESVAVWCNGTAWMAIVVPTPGSLTLPRGYLSGLGLANGTDADHDIDIAVGECRDSANAYDMVLASTLTKQIDAAWTAGDAAGGLFTGTVAADTWYHVHLIRKISNGQIDAGFDTSVSAGNIPSGWAAYRRLGSVLTDASANIIGFHQNGDTFLWDGLGSLDLDAGSSATAALVTLSVPPGVRVEAQFAAYYFSGGAGEILFSSPDVSDSAPDTSAWPLASERRVGEGELHGQHRIWTNTSSQVRLRATSAGETIRVATHGWREQL